MMFVKKAILMLLLAMCIASVVYAQSRGNIVFVSLQDGVKIDPATGDYPDMPHIYALEDEGYTVTIFYNASLSTAEPATLDTLYNADLIVMGRSTPSPQYAESKTTWNDIPTPILNLELWNCRSSRLNWFNTESMVSLGDEGVIFNALIDAPDDPVFEGFDTLAPIPWVVGPLDAVGAKDAGNGQVLARMATDSTVLFVRFEPEVEFYDGAGDMPAGYRTVIGNGRDNSGQAPFHYYNFTVESELVFFAEVARLIALGKGGSAVQEHAKPKTPSTLILSQNYPNPFNPTTTIPFQLREHSHVRLTITDILGNKITELINGEYQAGEHEIVFDAGDLAAGVYFYRMITERESKVRKLAVVK